MTSLRLSLPPAWRPVLASYLPCAVLAVCFAAIYVRVEQPVYAWDWGMHWGIFRWLGRSLLEDPWKAGREVFETIQGSDYNALGLVPLVPVYLAFGGERLPYIAALCALYVVPAAMMAARLAQIGRPGTSPGWLAPVCALLTPVFWNAALRGMIDVVGLIPLGMASIIIWRSRFLTAASKKEAYVVGVMLWLTFLIRRWYAFSLVALIALAVIAAGLRLWHGRSSAPVDALRQRAKLTLENWVAAGLVVVLGLLVQLPLVIRILNTDYSNIYSAYQRPALEQLQSYYANFGPVFAVFLALGVAVDVVHRNGKNLFFLAVAVFTVLLFARVQAPSVHHFLPVAFMLFPAYFSGVSCAWRVLSRALRPLVLFILVLSFANTYIPPSAGAVQIARSILGGPAYPPLHLDNFEEYRRLVNDLLATGEGQKVAVYASSVNLSQSLLLALDGRLGSKLAVTGEVDLRDRFDWRALDAEYAVITRTAQLHLDPFGQRVVTIPTEEIAGGTGIGRSFVSTGQTYRLENGVVVEVYRRTRPIPVHDVNDFKERFFKIYPDWRTADKEGTSAD